MDFKEMAKKRKEKIAKIKKQKKLNKKTKRIHYTKTLAKWFKIKSVLFRAWFKKNISVLLRISIFIISVLLVTGVIGGGIFNELIYDEINVNDLEMNVSSIGKVIITVLVSATILSSTITSGFSSLTYKDLNDKARNKLINLGYKSDKLDIIEDGIELFIGSDIDLDSDENVLSTLLQVPDEDESTFNSIKRTVTEFVDIVKTPVEPIYKDIEVKKEKQKSTFNKVDESKLVDGDNQSNNRRGGPLKR